MKEDFTDKIALVTGGGSGIGRGIALSFAEAGAKVVIADITIEGGKETERQINENGGESIFIKADVSKNIEVEALINEIIERYERVDYACNNAGIEGATAPIAESTEEDWDRTININLKGVWLCMKYEIIQMLKQGKGAIVNIASIMGMVASPFIAPYVAAKHGVIGLTKTAALEYPKDGIRINAVCPGVIHTSIIDRVTIEHPEIVEGLKAAIPVGKFGQPEDIANAVLYLCSDAASYVTGHSMVVDGAFIAQ